MVLNSDLCICNFCDVVFFKGKKEITIFNFANATYILKPNIMDQKGIKKSHSQIKRIKEAKKESPLQPPNKR